MSNKQTAAAAIAFMKNSLNVEELDTNAEPPSWWEPCSERSVSFTSLNSLDSPFSSALDAVQKSLKNNTIGDNQHSGGGGGRSDDGSEINYSFDSLDESAILTDFSDNSEELNAGMPRTITTTSDSEREEETISSSFEGSEPGETTNSNNNKITSTEETSTTTSETTSSWSTSDSDSTSFVDSFYTSSDNSSSSWGSSSSFPTSSTSSEESSSIVESD